MYSKNDYRYYLEHQLMYSDDYLAHYGVIGMKWGVRHDERRASLVSKKDANNAKIANYQKKLNTVGAQKRAAKAAKYKAKQDKYDRKAARARTRLAQGKNLSKGEMKKISKAEKYRAKVAKNSKKNDKYQAKIANLQKKNARLDRKISKMDKPSRTGAKAYRKGLNKLDKKRATSAYDSKVKKGKKQDKAIKKLNERTQAIKDTKEDAIRRGYTVEERSKLRQVHPGRTAAQVGLMGLVPGIAVGFVEDNHAIRKYGASRFNVEGKKYTVKKPQKK